MLISAPFAALPEYGRTMTEALGRTLERRTEDFLNRFEAAALRYSEVQDCYLMTGSADYLMKLNVKDTSDYERLHKEVLSRLPGVTRLQSSFAIRTVVSPDHRQARLSVR